MLNSSLGTLSFGVGSDGKAYYKIGGADTEYPFNSDANGILTIDYAFSMTMSTNDGGVGSGSGRITVTLTNGAITNYSMTGTGSAMTVGARPEAGICNASNFRITGISWTPQ